LSDRYILKDGLPIPEPDLMKWAGWFENADKERRVALTERDGVMVSTVFLSLDHNFVRRGPPLLYETLVRGGDHDGEMDRYSTKEEAVAGHEQMVKLCFPDSLSPSHP
jgi:hypothetical protein